MKLDLYGLVFDSAGATIYLWSPWRATSIEVRLFETVSRLPGVSPIEKRDDEMRFHVAEEKIWRQMIQTVARVMKGWQEEAAETNEKRLWRWFLEADTDTDGYDHLGERSAVWGFLRVALERGNPGEGEKSEELELENFRSEERRVGKECRL